MNRREHPRIEVQLKCRIDSAREWRRSWSGYTDNLSRGGILMSCPDPAGASPAPGEPVTVEIELPANHRFGPKCIHCQAVVIRVLRPAADAGRLAVALTTNQMQFRPHPQRGLHAWAAPPPQ